MISTSHECTVEQPVAPDSVHDVRETESFYFLFTSNKQDAHTSVNRAFIVEGDSSLHEQCLHAVVSSDAS